ncbi:MAG TPA: ABC transporter permease, partial [Gammaproteobacteria bacterium]|nr:ABC transporter permease [Gammaproteobacteria bacterium]
MLLDLKSACRELLKNRWFTCVTVLTLALGLGANTAIFGVVNKLLLNPLPYPDSDRIVYLRVGLQRAQFVFPPPVAVASAWREEARSFEGFEGSSSNSVLAYDENGARLLRGMRFTPGLPAFLGVAPVLGRGFTPADIEPGAPAVVMLSYEMWQRDYGGSRDVVGRAITLDDLPHVVVGVMPPRWDAFAVGFRPEVLFPQAYPVAGAQPVSVDIMTRLREDVSLDAATNELAAILARVSAESPRPLFGPDAPTVKIQTPTERTAANTRDALLVLLAAVGLVLLVACSNVANLLLARGASRSRELSLRSALGASTWRLVRALFAECLVLALAAGVVGLGVGWLTLRILVGLRPGSLTAIGEAELDPTVLAFTFGVSVLTALLFGLAPALQLASRRLGDALRGGASGVVRGGMGPRLRKLLVAAQMAISVVLLVSAGLLIRSFIHLQSAEIGFDAENLFSVQLSMPRAKYQTPTSREVFAEQLLERLRSSPGVTTATQVFSAPPNGVTFVGSSGFEIRGASLSEADAQAARIMHFAGADYFSALRIALIEGRTFTADEMRSKTAVIVNRAAAEHFWPDGEALGGEIKWQQDWATVIGVVDNVLFGSLTRGRDTPQFYWPLPMGPSFTGGPASLTFVVRAAEDSAIAIAASRAAVQALDPEIAIANVLLTETAIANTIDAPRFNMALLTAFAGIALVLAAVGLAAVIGYEVTERTHEIGIRMALGARAENVRRLAMRHGLTPAFLGMVLGVVGALAATKLAASLLYGITPRDPLTFAGVVALLVLVALGAAWLPARRATR